MGMVLVESMKSSLVLDDPERLRVDIPDDVAAVLEDPDRGLIVVSGHLGNWEIAGTVAVALQAGRGHLPADEQPASPGTRAQPAAAGVGSG